MNDKLLKELKKTIKEEKYFRCIDDEYLSKPEIIKYQRKLDIRHIDNKRKVNKGYDILNEVFFVYEKVRTRSGGLTDHIAYFKTFNKYYDFLDGDIYNKSCYYGYEFTRYSIKEYKIDINKLNFKPLYSEKISSKLNPKTEDIFGCEILSNKKHELISKKLKELNKCKTKHDYVSFVKNNSRISEVTEYVYPIYSIQNVDKSFDLLIAAINNRQYWNLINLFCYLYKDINSFDYSLIETGNKSWNYKTRKKIKENLKFYKNNIASETLSNKYDNYSGYYNTHISFFEFGSKEIDLYFIDIKSFSKYLNNDFSGCNFLYSKDNIDFSKFKTDRKTIYPYKKIINYEYKYKINYQNIYGLNQFNIYVEWFDKNGNIVYSEDKDINFLFELLYYTNNDLSNSNLLNCNSLANLNSIDNICMKNTLLPKSLINKFNIKREEIITDTVAINDVIENNEKQTALTLKQEFNVVDVSKENSRNYVKIHYISDLHLSVKIQKRKLKTYEDVYLFIDDVVSKLLSNNTDFCALCDNVYLFAGDISSDFIYFKMFLDVLSCHSQYGQFVFTLGNHELWMNNQKYENIVKKYRNEIENHGFIMLQNDLLCMTEHKFKIINEKTLLKISNENLSNVLIETSFVILGGIGFSGLNNSFNAESGIYRDCISRNEEIKQSELFLKIYNKINSCIKNKPMIVLSHMPKYDWDESQSCLPNCIYVSGHTHKNYFYDDLETRIYADNQVGYEKENYRFKFFYIEDNYDIFINYDDGIYEIDSYQYISFLHGKNISADFSRDGKLIMLKKNGYYCFIYDTGKSLCILNGGSLKKLNSNSINYYYDNMDKQIALLSKPFNKYSKILNSISKEIIDFGGLGRIHGFIVDIDYFNHVYLNPFDLQITCYYALDIIEKYVYSDISHLLKAHRPDLYLEYKKNKKQNNALMLSNSNVKNKKTVLYLDTNIYKASREMKKMQKLDNNILAKWEDLGNEPNMIV